MTPVRPFALAALAALATGCVVIPYTPTAEHHRSAPPPTAGLRLGAGPRGWLQDLGAAIAAREPRCVVLEPQQARDALFPTGDWRLPLPPRHDDAALPADVLVVLAPLQRQCDTWGEFFFYVGCFGLDRTCEQAGLQAVVIDVPSGRAIAAVEVACRGWQFRCGLFAALWIEPLVDRGLRQGAATAIAATLADRTGATLRLAVLAAEDPLPPP